MRLDKWIIAAWIMYFVALLMPWTEKLGSGWLYGWFWHFLDLPMFILFISFDQTDLKGLASSFAVLASLIMWLSPWLAYLVKKGRLGFYCYLPMLALIFAVFASGLKFYSFALSSSLIPMYVIGNIVWVIAFILLSRGFFRQMAYIKQNTIQA